MLYPSAMVKAVASLSLSNQSFTNWPLYPYHMEISRPRTARSPTLGLAHGSPAAASGSGFGVLGKPRGARAPGRAADPHVLPSAAARRPGVGLGEELRQVGGGGGSPSPRGMVASRTSNYTADYECGAPSTRPTPFRYSLRQNYTTQHCQVTSDGGARPGRPSAGRDSVKVVL